jgi:curved DNA-binding protein CbpA
MALKFHPDKNRAPGADDAFKAVARAFSTLADADKRAAYDRFGVSSTGANAPPFAHAFSGASAGFPFAAGAGGHDISPEELFNLFFQSAFAGNGNGFPGSGFPGNGGFYFGSGGFGTFANAGHFRARGNPFHAHAHAHRRRAPPSDFNELYNRLIQLVPLFVLFVLAVLNSWIFPQNPAPADGLFTGEMPAPQSFNGISHLVSLTQKPSHPHARLTGPRSLEYFASGEFQKYFGSVGAASDGGVAGKNRRRELAIYEASIESASLKALSEQCRIEQKEWTRRIRDAQKDPAELKRLLANKPKACERLSRLNRNK